MSIDLMVILGIFAGIIVTYYGLAIYGLKRQLDELQEVIKNFPKPDELAESIAKIALTIEDMPEELKERLKNKGDGNIGKYNPPPFPEEAQSYLG